MEVSKLTRMECRQDVDWRVEQRLARVLAERDLYWDGFIHGVWITVLIVAALAVAVWNQINFRETI